MAKIRRKEPITRSKWYVTIILMVVMFLSFAVQMDRSRLAANLRRASAAPGILEATAAKAPSPAVVVQPASLAPVAVAVAVAAPPPPSAASATATANLEWWQKPKPLLADWPRLEKRNDIHPWLEKLGYKRGIEVGVQKGQLAKVTLRSWASCEEYKLVDLWGADPNYKEPGVDNNDAKNQFLAQAKDKLRQYTNKGVTEFFVMRSVDAAPKFKDNHFDYIYVDARHDYCAVTEDIEHYWPKVRPGGILAGHDFIDAATAKELLGPAEDWSACEDGSIQPSAVKGAVEAFAKKHNLKIVTTHEGFDTWLLQKPYE